MAPRWSNAISTMRQAVAVEKVITERRPDFTHYLDQFRSAMRDALDDQGLSIVDEDVLYTALVFSAMFADVATWLERLGLVDAEKVADLGTVVGALGLLLAPYTPEEARS